MSNEIELTLKDVLHAQHVERWHMSDMIKRQNVAAHSFNVAMISMAILNKIRSGNAYIPTGISVNLIYLILWESLTHDVDEVLFGDIMPQTKEFFQIRKKFPDLKINPILDSGELTEWENNFMVSIVKLADTIDAWYFVDSYGLGTEKQNIITQLAKKEKLFIGRLSDSLQVSRDRIYRLVSTLKLSLEGDAHTKDRL